MVSCWTMWLNNLKTLDRINKKQENFTTWEWKQHSSWNFRNLWVPYFCFGSVWAFENVFFLMNFVSRSFSEVIIFFRYVFIPSFGFDKENWNSYSKIFVLATLLTCTQFKRHVIIMSFNCGKDRVFLDCDSL